MNKVVFLFGRHGAWQRIKCSIPIDRKQHKILLIPEKCVRFQFPYTSNINTTNIFQCILLNYQPATGPEQITYTILLNLAAL